MAIIENSLEKEIPKKLRELGEKDESFVSIFQVTDINWLEKLYERLLEGGDLFEFNKNTANRQPSAAIGKYIEFLKQNIMSKVTYWHLQMSNPKGGKELSIETTKEKLKDHSVIWIGEKGT